MGLGREGQTLRDSQRFDSQNILDQKGPGINLSYGAAAFVSMVVFGANTLACIVIGHRKNANLFMLFIAVSFISIFVVLSLFGAVFSFFAGQATTPYRRQDDDW